MDLTLRDFSLLQVVPALQTGGVEQTAIDVARAVVAAGGRAFVASSGGRMEQELIDDGGVSVRMPLASKNPLTVLLNARRLIALIRKQKISLIHVRSRAPAFSAVLAARRTGVPLVTTYHGVYNARSAAKRWYNRIMTRGDVTIANSEFTRVHVLEEHGAPERSVIAVPRGVDLKRFDPDSIAPERVTAIRISWGVAAEDPRLVLLLAGRLTRWKGQLLMIEALAELRKKRGADPMVLILAGEDQGRKRYSDTLRAAIAGHGLHDVVKMVGHVNDMPAAYLAADAAAAPSLEPEAFGRTAVEPQAMGRPVLAADHGAVRETVVHGETGWRIKPGDAHAWASALETLLDLGAEGRAAMGRAGRARAQALYSLETMTDKTLSIYREVLGRRYG